jgi:hypothetical protein
MDTLILAYLFIAAARKSIINVSGRSGGDVISSETATVASRMPFPFPTRSRAKESLFDHATTHIEYLELEMTQQQLQTRQAVNESLPPAFTSALPPMASIFILY